MRKLIKELLREGSYDKYVRLGKDVVDNIRNINVSIDKELDNVLFNKSKNVYCKGGAARLALLIYCNIDYNGGVYWDDVIRDSDFVLIGDYNSSIMVDEYNQTYESYFSSRDISLNEVLLNPDELIFTRRAYRDAKNQKVSPTKFSSDYELFKNERIISRLLLFAARYNFNLPKKFNYDWNSNTINFETLVCLLKAYELGIEGKYFDVFKRYVKNFNVNSLGEWLVELIRNIPNFNFGDRGELIINDLANVNDLNVLNILNNELYPYYPDLKKRVNNLTVDDNFFKQYFKKINRGKSSSSMRRTTPKFELNEFIVKDTIRNLLRGGLLKNEKVG